MQKCGRLTSAEKAEITKLKAENKTNKEIAQLLDIDPSTVSKAIKRLTSVPTIKQPPKLNIKHGLYKHPLYPVWKGMMQNCYYEFATSYERIGGKGIKVCKRWHDVTKFVADIKVKPPNQIFARLDKTKDFTPDNCYWMTRHDSIINSQLVKKLSEEDRAEIHNLKQNKVPAKLIARQFNVSVSTINRFYRRDTLEVKLTKPWLGKDSISELKQLKASGKSAAEIAAIFGISLSFVYNILKDRYKCCGEAA